MLSLLQSFLAIAGGFLLLLPAKAAQNDLGPYEGRLIMVQSLVSECKAFQVLGTTQETKCDAAYTLVQRIRFQHGRVFSETLSLKAEGNAIASAQTAKADAGTIALVGQEIDLVAHPELKPYWREIEGQKVKSLVVSARREGNILKFSNHSIAEAEVDAAGQTYSAEFDQVSSGEIELINGKCKYRQNRWDADVRMRISKPGFGIGIIANDIKAKYNFRTTDTICSVAK